jgi:hypothetical protein
MRPKVFRVGNFPAIPYEAPVQSRENMKFLRSWLVFSEIPAGSSQSQTHKALGLVLAFVFSASFWTGLGWMIASAWK